MKRNHLLGVLSSALMCLTSVAQESESASCTENQITVETLLTREYLSKKQQVKIFKFAETCALKGNAEAAYNMGILYKDGVGCALDFDKSKYWFEKAVTLGSQKAAYALGYLYLKGLGSVDQDYTKALSWFSKSDYGMAKHWLAYCTYFGYGIPANKAKALVMLKENQILNSQTLATQLEQEMRPVTSIPATQRSTVSADLEPIITKKNPGSSTPVIQKKIPQDITGNWEGKLVEFDWSAKEVVRSIPVAMNFEKLNNPHNVSCSLMVNGESKDTNTIWQDGVLTFSDAQFTLNRQYTDHPEHLTLEYDLLSVNFEQKIIDDNTYIVGTLETQIKEWSEPGSPMLFVLTNTGSSLSEEAILALGAQKENFIKLYPNPFASDLLIQYELKQTANVQISFYNYTGTYQKVISPSNLQKAGMHTLTLNDLDVPNGLYVVRVDVNGKVYTKMVTKK